jgi:hypothetical protein
MDVQLLDIDLEPVQTIEVEEKRIFGYNRVDLGMIVLSALLFLMLIGFFIWFGVEHSK